jgi:hypothetical protein
MVLTAFLVGLLLHWFGVGLTSTTAPTAAMFLFAAWASSAAGSSGQGLVAGCVLFSVSAGLAGWGVSL